MENLDQIEELKSFPELIAKLYQNSVLKKYKTGSIILNENAYIRVIPIVSKGSMKVIRTEEDGRGGMHNETDKVRAAIFTGNLWAALAVHVPSPLVP